MLNKIRQFITGSNLRNKFVLFFIVLATVPVLVLGGMTLFLLDLSHRQDVSSLELQLLGQKSEEIGKFFADTLDVIRIRIGITQSAEVESSILPWQQVLARGILEENSAFEAVTLIDLQGKERAKETRQNIDHEFIDVSYLPKFMVAKEGEEYISDVYYTLSGPMITLSAPITVEDSIIQIVSAEVNLSQVIRSIENAFVGTSGYVVLFDKNGSLIAAGSPGMVSVGKDYSAFSRVKRVLAGEVLSGLDKHDRYESLFGGSSVVGAGQKLTSTGWGLLVEWPLSDADSVIADVRKQIIQFTFVSIFAVLLLAPLFANRLTEPIRKLSVGAEEIQKGNFEKQVSIKTGDELEELGKEFNKMAKGLKRLQELKDEFVFISTHELRAPVTAIKGYLSMIFEGDGGPISSELKELLEPVAMANKRLVNLVNDLLDVARAESGKLQIDVFSINISASIESIITEVKAITQEKKVSISYKKPKEPFIVLADTGRIKEVVMNFISNAIKYNRPDGWIKIYHELEEGYVITHIEDNGYGISEKNQSHIFEKFYREKSSKTTGVGGTGLGLFITKELVERMQGEAWFRSKEGEGTRFSFKLKEGTQVDPNEI